MSTGDVATPAAPAQRLVAASESTTCACVPWGAVDEMTLRPQPPAFNFACMIYGCSAQPQGLKRALLELVESVQQREGEKGRNNVHA